MSKKQRVKKKQIRKEQRRRKKQIKKDKNKGTKENKDEYKDPSTDINVLEEFLNDPSEQSNQTKQQTIPSNPSEEDHNNQSTNPNDNIGIKHEQKDQKEEQPKLVLKKKDVQLIGIVKIDENDKSDSLVPNPEEGMPKDPVSQFVSLDKDMNDHEIGVNANLKSTSVNDKKHNVQTKKHIFPKKNHQRKKSNKNSHKKFMKMFSRKNNIEQSNLIKDSIKASMKGKKNADIVDNNVNKENNMFSHDNSHLDPCKNSNHDEQGNTPCSRIVLIKRSPHGKLSSKEMEPLQEADIEFKFILNPKPKYDGIEGDNDVNRVSIDGITNSQNINANYGIYKKECAKDMKTEDNLH